MAAEEDPMQMALGRKDDPAFAGEAEPETVSGQPEPEGQASPVETDAERTAREQMADATRKWQEAAEMRRQAEAQVAQITARERALNARAEALKPLQEFDRMVATDPALRDAVTPYIEGYRPGAAQLPTDDFVQQLEQVKQQNAAMAVTYARSLLTTRYTDFTANETQVAETARRYGLLQPGMTAEQIVDGLDAAYQLATRPKAVAQQQAQAQVAAARNADAAKVGAGGGASNRGVPQPELSTRRADGSLMSYEEISDAARSIKR